MKAVERVWGIKPRKAEVLQAPIPVLEPKTVEPKAEDLVVPIVPPSPPASKHHSATHRHGKTAPLWLVIAFGVAAGIFLLVAATTAMQLREAYATHSRILEKLVTLAAPPVRAAVSIPAQDSFESLLAQLQA